MKLFTKRFVTKKFCALSLPLPLHHFGEPVDDDIQKATDDETENAQCNREARLGTDKFF